MAIAYTSCYHFGFLIPNIMDINSYWDWNEFGFCFKISRTGNHSDYLFMIDFHFLFFDCWINFYSKK